MASFKMTQGVSRVPEDVFVEDGMTVTSGGLTVTAGGLTVRYDYSWGIIYTRFSYSNCNSNTDKR